MGRIASGKRNDESASITTLKGFKLVNNAIIDLAPLVFAESVVSVRLFVSFAPPVHVLLFF
jgi:hypothetical protein